MIEFRYLPKENAEKYLPGLFDILHLNTSKIAPAETNYEEEFDKWHGAVAPALEKKSRQIILIYDGGKVIGYFQYYVNDTTFMMEEIQLLPEYQGKGVFQKLYAYLARVVPADILVVEAYADKRNERSQSILRHLGLEGTEDGEFVRFRGECQPMLERYRTKTVSIYGENRITPYEKLREGCRGIVIRDGKILVSREGKTGIVMIPGGGLEREETLEECCRRELAEETGYVVEPEMCFLELDEYYGEFKFVGYYYICRVVGTCGRHLTEQEKDVGMAPVWMDVDEFVDILSRYGDYAGIDEDRRGMYLREYTAMREYLDQIERRRGVKDEIS